MAHSTGHRTLAVALTTLVLSAGCGGLMDQEAVTQTTPSEGTVVATQQVSAKDRLAKLPSSKWVDPLDDEVLEYVATAIPDVTDDQLLAVAELYIALRDKQAASLERMRQGRARNAGASKEVGPVQLNRLAKMEDAFLADGRQLMRPDQYEAWDECATAVDLTFPGIEGAKKGLATGEPAPNFSLRTLDGKTIDLTALRGKPVIVEFGSYTCPIYRGNTGAVADLVTKHGDKAHFITVYGYEAHPVDGWVVAQNTREGIEIKQHTNLDDRFAAAKSTMSKLGIQSTMVVDGMDNAVTDAWHGHPNGAYILDSEGAVVDHMIIIDPVEIDRYLTAQ